MQVSLSASASCRLHSRKHHICGFLPLLTLFPRNTKCIMYQTRQQVLQLMYWFPENGPGKEGVQAVAVTQVRALAGLLTPSQEMFARL
ncbi:unnamed protein product [Pleuronectes platessa]|uniref:Uncharacterized protein n=1 Tax=Pleuronectes platessa TaxID=8262 RepID=A0A9N7TMJ0_PLEPL|nr:unnamed protein product [Pleuronectes platessa]